MAASNTDKFKKAKRKFSTTIGSGGFSLGATTLPLVSTTGLDTDTGITLVLDANTVSEEVITGVVSGSNVINCVRAKEGTADVTHAAGANVAMYFTETHWDDLVDGILVSHNQDGTYKNNDNVLPKGLNSSAVATDWNWVAFTPTLTNFTIGTGGSASNTGYYCLMGKICHVRTNAVLGTSGQSVGGTVSITPPITPVSNIAPSGNYLILGSGTAFAGTTSYVAYVKGNSTSSFEFAYVASTGIITSTTASLPATWVAGNYIATQFYYEVA